MSHTGVFDRIALEDDPYVIAEVGQNHQGDLDTARRYIREFAPLGANAIKFQVRNNKNLFSVEKYNAAYHSENAFGETYGAHREALELEPDELAVLRADCRDANVHFMATPFDEESLDLLISLDVDIIKIASFDVGNLPFISRIAEAGKPVVISIGGAQFAQIESSIELLEGLRDVAILHCVSEYPCPADRLGLDNVARLAEAFPNHAIGLSDHFSGILSGPVAYMKGARVFEKHVTFSHSWKGTDHSFALMPDGFRRFARDIRRVPDMLNEKPKAELGTEPVFRKLGKSVVARHNLEAGTLLSLDNLSGKIFEDQGIPVRESNSLIGMQIRTDVGAGELIERSNVVGLEN